MRRNDVILGGQSAVLHSKFNVSSTNSRYVNSILNMNDSLHFVQNLKMCESSFHATMQDKMFVNGNKNQ